MGTADRKHPSAMEGVGGAVNYVDYGTSFIPERTVFAPFMHKRLSFAFEHEVRLLLWSGSDTGPTLAVGELPPLGYDVSVDLDRLAEEIYIAPDAPAWFADLVGKVLVRYGRSWPTKHSDLATDPVG